MMALALVTEPDAPASKGVTLEIPKSRTLIVRPPSDRRTQ